MSIPSGKLMALDLPNVCNTGCIFCDYRTDKINITLSDLIQQVDLIKKLNVSKKIAIGGGEPLVFSWFPDLIKYISDRGLFATICTNGIMIDKINETVFDQIGHIVVSALSYSKDIYDKMRPNGQYERLWDNLRWLQQRYDRKDDKFSVVFLICSLNSDTIYDEVSKCSEMGYDVGLNLIQKKFSASQITDDIKFLFDIDLDRLETNLKKLSDQFPRAMNDGWAVEIIRYFRLIKENNYQFGSDCEHPVCNAKIINIINNNGEPIYTCNHHIVRGKSMTELNIRAKRCKRWCGVDCCNCLFNERVVV